MATLTLPPLDFIALDVVGPDLEGVLKELFESVRSKGLMRDPARVWTDLVARQAAGSVVLDEDVALPHARTSGVDRFVLAAARTADGVQFDRAHREVRLVFLILTPKERPAEYLQVLAALAGRLRDAGVRERLLSTPSEQEFSRLLEPRAAA